MTTAGRPLARRPRRSSGKRELRARLTEAEQTLDAIRRGGVDALVVAGRRGPRVFSLEGADHAYRQLIESMNEGALTLSSQSVILYANGRFATMVKCPLEQIIGSPFQRFLSEGDRAPQATLLKRPRRSGSRAQVSLLASDGSEVPAQISIHSLPPDGSVGSRFGVVVTDMTEPRRSEETLRVLTHRLTEAQESERDQVAIKLTEEIAQSLVAVLLRFRTMVDGFPAHDQASRQEVLKVGDMIAEIAEELEVVSRALRPSILKHLGLAPALRAACAEFGKRTGLRIDLKCDQLAPRPPAESKLALYRIFQEALRNIEKHAGASRVSVRLSQRDGFAELAIRDDGAGFTPDPSATARDRTGGIGLFHLRERAAFLGGVLTIKSAPRAGTVIKVRIPLPVEGPAT